MDHVQTQPQDQFDVLVVGAGPAGLMAAEQAARAGLRVAVAEAMPSPARKFLMAGKSWPLYTSDAADDLTRSGLVWRPVHVQSIMS